MLRRSRRRSHWCASYMGSGNRCGRYRRRSPRVGTSRAAAGPTLRLRCRRCCGGIKGAPDLANLPLARMPLFDSQRGAGCAPWLFDVGTLSHLAGIGTAPPETTRAIVVLGAVTCPRGLASRRSSWETVTDKKCLEISHCLSVTRACSATSANASSLPLSRFGVSRPGTALSTATSRRAASADSAVSVGIGLPTPL
jgi:hypothetical protein